MMLVRVTGVMLHIMAAQTVLMGLKVGKETADMCDLYMLWLTVYFEKCDKQENRILEILKT